MQEREGKGEIVVGRDNQQTPSFRDELTYIVFNPTWTVPASIQRAVATLIGSNWHSTLYSSLKRCATTSNCN